MFNNIGGKIKTLASVITWIGIICSIVGGATMMGFLFPLPGLLIMIVGSLASWISSFLLYAFGQLVENTDKLVNTRGGYAPSSQHVNYQSGGQPTGYRQNAPQPAPVYSETGLTLSTLEKWRSEGVISEEEYNLLVEQRRNP